MPWPTTIPAAKQVEFVVAEKLKLRIYAPSVFVTTFDYDFAVSGGSGAITISSQFVPAGAKVIGGWYQVSTTFSTASADAGTIALSLVGANDLVTAIAVSDASNPWDVDLTGRKPLKLIATVVAAQKQVVLTVATANVEAGVLFGAVEWMLPTNVSSGH